MAEKQKLQTWTIDVVETRSVQVKVKARSQSGAEALASTTAHSDGRWPASTTRTMVVNHWPADETEEIEHDLGNGYRVARGWWWQVNLVTDRPDLGRRVVRRTTVSFKPDLVDPCNYGVTADSFVNLAGRREHIHSFSKAYGWAATFTGSSTWSKVHQDHRKAYDDCVAFVTAERMDRDEWRRYCAMLHHIAENGGRLERLKGGRWIIPGGDLREVANAVEGIDWYLNKGEVDHLIAEDAVKVTDLLTISDKPREIEITQAGRERAEAWASLPELFR
jgi:hypothetical protein